MTTADKTGVSGTYYDCYTDTTDYGNLSLNVYLCNEPPLKAGDSITYKFKITRNFESGKTYMVSADDPLAYSHGLGDTAEIITELDRASNNLFVFTTL